MSAAARILDRLERVKPTGPGRWISSCPAHDDRSPSLSIRETGDGRVLVHCFAECETAAVLAALGLTVSDLFDRPLDQRYALPPVRSTLPARELLELVSHEINVVVIVLIEVLEDKFCSEAQLQQLMTSSRRIARARNCMNGSR